MKKNILFFVAILLILTSFSLKKHPYHVGSVEFNFNSKSKTFEITGKFFLDDLENAVNAKYGGNLRFNNDRMKPEMNTALQKYCAEYLKLKTDNKFLKMNYLGFEEDKESVNIYLESETIKSPKKVETAVSLLYNYFDDQFNIIHITVGGQRKSQKLAYPERYLYQNF